MKSQPESEPEPEVAPKEEKVKDEETKKEILKAKKRAKEALEDRGKRSSNAMYYWGVAIAFAVMCVGCVIYVIREWRESPNLVSAISAADIQRHNAITGATFQRGPNLQFEVEEIAKE